MRVARRVLAAIAAEAAASPDREVCGLLLGRGDGVDDLLSCRNVHPDPRRSFEIDPGALIRAYRRVRAGGPTIAGCYHSHPTGAASPSPRDAAAAAANGWLWLIAGGGTVAAFRAVPFGSIHGRFVVVDMVEADGV